MKPWTAASLAVLVHGCAPASPHTTPSVASEPAHEPSQKPSTNVPSEVPAPKALLLSRWASVPAQIHALEGQTFASHGADLAIEREGEFQQDGLVARVPDCVNEPGTVGEILGLAGHWPKQAFQLRSSRDSDSSGSLLYRWKGKQWRRIRHIKRPDPRLATHRGTALLLSAQVAPLRGYRIETLERGAVAPRPAPGSVDGCATAVAELVGLASNARGDLVVWGTGCEQEGVVEVFPAKGSSQIFHFEGYEVTAAQPSATGQLFVARMATATGSAELLVRTNEGWEQKPLPPSRITSLAPRPSGLLAIVTELGDTPTRVLELGQKKWRERSLPETAEAPRALVIGPDDDTLWITSDKSLWGTQPPTHEDPWLRTGCEVDPLRGAPRYRFRSKDRPPRWHCPGGIFVHVETTSGSPSAAWQRLYHAMPFAIEQGYRKARARRPVPDSPPIELLPGIPVLPVVARELNRLHFGFQLGRGRDDERRVLDIWQRAEKVLGKGPLIKILCAKPISLAEPRVRALATANSG